MSFPGWRYDVGRVTDLNLVHGRQFQSGSSDLFDVLRATAAGQVSALVSILFGEPYHAGEWEILTS